MKQRILTVDGNWYLHRAFHTLRTNRPIEDALPYHLMQMVCKDALVTRSNYLCVAFDGPKIFRYKLYPKYKWERHQRKGGAPVDAENADLEPDSLYVYLPVIYKAFQDAGIIMYQPRFGEADDVLRSVAHVYEPQGYVCIGAAQDKDGFQWLKPKRCMMYDASFKNKAGENIGRYITSDVAEAKIGIPISQMIDYQTLIGDKGDSIPPIEGIGPATAKKILKQYGSIRNWYKQDADSRQFLAQQQAALTRNRKLVTLRTDMLPPEELKAWRLPKIKPKISSLPKSFHAYHDFLWPRSKGLFG
jgi:DNA polymerase-1